MTNRRDFLTRIGLASMALAAAPLVSTRSYFFAPHSGWPYDPLHDPRIGWSVRYSTTILDNNRMIMLEPGGIKWHHIFMMQELGRQHALTVDRIVLREIT